MLLSNITTATKTVKIKCLERCFFDKTVVLCFSTVLAESTGLGLMIYNQNFIAHPGLQLEYAILCLA